MLQDFPDATEGDKVLVSESMIRKALKTSCCHIKKMTARQKVMCGCTTCVITDDVVKCVNSWRRKHINKWRAEIRAMAEGTGKVQQEEKLKQYIEFVCSDEEGEKPKYGTAWDASSQMGCSLVKIGDHEYARFGCVLNKCEECKDKWSTLVSQHELECDDMISYVLFGSHHKCTEHGDGINVIEKNDKGHFCKICSLMGQEEKEELKDGPPSIKMIKVRAKLAEKMKDFMKPGGTYEEFMWKMYYHAAHARLLGSRFCGRMCYEFAELRDDIMLFELDYAEKWQQVANGEIQPEHFGKDASVSMEVCIATIKDVLEDGSRKKKTLSYATLSDQKKQVAATTMANIFKVLDDIFSKDNLTMDDVQMIIDITDGCPAQYKCYTALWTLSVISKRTGKLYFRCVKCAGHGKCRCDAEGGKHKTRADRAFDNFVVLPETGIAGVHTVPTHRVENGALMSLAEVMFGILDDDEYRFGARTHQAQRARDENRVISERRFLLRLLDEAKNMGVRMTAHEDFDFEDGQYMGLRAYHNFVADALIEGYAIMTRRIPCLCPPCRARFDLPTPKERYQNPCDDCEYWEMYRGWNDWKEIRFAPTTKCDEDDLMESQALTLQIIGEKMAKSITVGGFGGYLADADRLKYYLVKWTSAPWQVGTDGMINDGVNDVSVSKGDWICKGVWLDYVPRARQWYTVSEDEVHVRCQTVLQSDLDLTPHGPDNELPTMNAASREAAIERSCIQLSDEDHDFLMDAAGDREELDYEMEVPLESLNGEEEEDDESDDNEYSDHELGD